MTDSTDDLERPGAVFVMGNGHSGSTLLEMLLLEGTRTVGLGELGQTLAAALDRGPAAHLLDRACLCGAEVAQCPLWSTLTSALEERWRSGTLDLNSAYGMVIDATRSMHPDAVIVESSKNARYLQALEAAIDRHVEVVHLVRDVRAWTISSRRKAAAEPASGLRRISRAWHFSSWARFTRWRRGNEDAESTLRGRPGGYVLASYEGLATVGPAYVAALRGLLSLPAAGTPAGAAITHAIHGNRARTSLRGGAAVVYSIGWLFEPGWMSVSVLRPSIMRLNRRWVGDTATRPVRRH